MVWVQSLSQAHINLCISASESMNQTGPECINTSVDYVERVSG